MDLIELDDQLDVGDKRKAWKIESMDSVLGGREFGRKRQITKDIDKNLNMELECLESI